MVLDVAAADTRALILEAARGRLLADGYAGLSNRKVAEELVISPKTVANHVEHIYAKIDASTRAQASLFAMQHGLLPEEMGQTPHADALARA